MHALPSWSPPSAPPRGDGGHHDPQNGPSTPHSTNEDVTPQRGHRQPNQAASTEARDKRAVRKDPIVNTKDIKHQNPSPSVVVDRVSKVFCRSLKRGLWYGLRDVAAEFAPLKRSGSRRLRKEEFSAVKDVSFSLEQGECLGLIGHNGAGKTTLLMMLNGLLKPDTGSITIRGRVGALIALGAGFNPLLTARENIHVNGSVLGLKAAEIRGMMDHIIEFAEIAGFVDTPVQYFSSGMRVRLGFAIASTIRPELLFLDEVLAVGDERFQLKCYDRIASLIGDGAAAILVSHQLQNIERICTRCIVLENGSVALDTTHVPDAIARYRNTKGTKPNALTIHYPDKESVRILAVDADASTGSVVVSYSSDLPPQTRVMMSYAVSHKGAELLRTTSLDTPTPYLPAGGGTFKLAPPDEFRTLSPLQINLSLWDHDRRSPLAWIKGITIDRSGQPAPQLRITTEQHA